MSHSPPETTPPPNPNPKPKPNLNLTRVKRNRTPSLPEPWAIEEALLRQVVSMSNKPHPPLVPPAADYTSLLSDALLLRILSLVPAATGNSLVCKRWCRLHGRLVESLTLNDWSFLSSGRVFRRFPNLTEIDLTRAWVKTPRNSGIVVSSSCHSLSFHVGTGAASTVPFLDRDGDVLAPDMVDYGLGLIAENCPNLRRLAVIGATEEGVSSVSRSCETLQEVELHCCDDLSLNGITRCRNLQVVKLVGKVEGFYDSVVSDIGLTILANGCTRLVKLELFGCEGSYDGIKAVGQCCLMLEELSLRDHRMDGGWLSGLSFCRNLKTLRLVACRGIDESPGLEEHLGKCVALEELRLERCRVRGQADGVKALFLVCDGVRDLRMKDCWGLEDDIFGFARVCRRVKFLSLEGCSLLTTAGLESAILHWNELGHLHVVSCNNIKDSEVSPELGSLFSALKELKWRPDSKSLLSSGLTETGVWNKGGRFFKG